MEYALELFPKGFTPSIAMPRNTLHGF